jgi:hypothetical protein
VAPAGKPSVIVALLALAVAGCAAARVQEPPRPAAPTPASGQKVPFVPGEVIVKFKASTEAGSIATAPPGGDPEPAFKSLATRLSSETGWPVEVRQALSGGDLLVAVRFDTMAERLLEQARRETSLADPSLECAEGEVRATPRVRARVTAKTPDAAALATRFSSALGFPVVARAESDGAIALTVDAEAATRSLVETLKRRSDVEYAQPNHVLKKIRP